MSAPLSIINESAFVGGKVELLEEGTTYLGELPRIRFKAKLQEANVVNQWKILYTRSFKYNCPALQLIFFH
jgi:hypothetical protein